MATKALRMYRKFHGKNPKKKRIVKLNDLKTLTFLGRAVAVEYECDKWNGGGDGTMAVYRHEFETECLLATDQDGKDLYIFGPELKVTRDGIEN